MEHHGREIRMQEPRESLGKDFFYRCLSVAVLQQWDNHSGTP